MSWVAAERVATQDAADAFTSRARVFLSQL